MSTVLLQCEGWDLNMKRTYPIYRDFAFDPFPFQRDDVAAPEVDVGGCKIGRLVSQSYRLKPSHSAACFIEKRQHKMQT